MARRSPCPRSTTRGRGGGPLPPPPTPTWTPSQAPGSRGAGSASRPGRRRGRSCTARPITTGITWASRRRSASSLDTRGCPTSSAATGGPSTGRSRCAKPAAGSSGDSPSGGVDGEADGAGRGCQPRVERRQGRRARRHRECQVKSIGGAQRSRRQAQKEVLRPTMNISSQLDAVVHALVEAPEDRVLKASRRLPRERPPTQTVGERGDDLGHGQIGHEDIVPALHDLIELVAAWLRQVELQQGAGVAIEGAGQARSVCGPLLAKPRRNAPLRSDPPGPRRPSWRVEGGGPASAGGTPRGSERPCREGDRAAPASPRDAPAP